MRLIRQILVTTALCAAASLAVLIFSGSGIRSAAVTGTAELANWGFDAGGGESSSTNYGVASGAGDLALGESESATYRAAGGFWTGVLCFDDNDGLDDAAEAVLGTNTCAFDSDVDSLGDGLESWCGSNPVSAPSKPERIDLPGDDDGDTLVDEALPTGAEPFDCDGDGYTGAAEAHVFTATNARDQDPCGGNGWPSDLAAPANKISLSDVTSFTSPAPKKLNTVPTDPGYNLRWDLKSPFTSIVLGDLTTLTAGLDGSPNKPPMLGGARAFNGPSCPWPP